MNIFKRDFTLVLIGQIISILGSAVLRFALDLYVLDITGRADIFAMVLAISTIPIVIFSPIGGAIADRFNRRNLMVIFDFCSSLIVLGLILMVAADMASVVWIAIIMTALSVITAMYQPAVQASIPALVDDQELVRANGMISGVGALSGLLGPVMGGILYGVMGLERLLIASGIAFAVSAVMEIFIRMPFSKPEQKKHIVPTIWDDMKEGIAFMVQKNPRIFRTVLLAAVLNLVLTSYMIVGAPYVLRITMKSSESLYGAGMGAIQLAGIAGALLIGVFAKNMKLETLYKWMFILAVLLLPIAGALTPVALGMGYWPSYCIFLLFLMAIMFVASVVSIFVITEVQRETPNEFLGKIMAIIFAISQCALPIGQLLYGVILEVFNRQMFIPALVALVLMIGIAFAGKSLLRAPETESFGQSVER